MHALIVVTGVVYITVGVITKLVGKDAVSEYFSKICQEIQDLDYKIAEALHFMEDGETIFPNIRLYNDKVRNVSQYVDSYYDVFANYERLVLERGPRRWFPVHFIEEVAEERFNWTYTDFQILKSLFKKSQDIYLNIKTKCKKWRKKTEEPTNIWGS
uniref:Uncharacterized protein n=1 Tax=Cuerna arida TaxID=1464854 RepID=A0A1B6FLC8_9HEMI